MGCFLFLSATEDLRLGGSGRGAYAQPWVSTVSTRGSRVRQAVSKQRPWAAVLPHFKHFNTR